MDEMLVGLRDVDEHASEELEWVDQGIVVEVVSGWAGCSRKRLGLLGS